MKNLYKPSQDKGCHSIAGAVDVELVVDPYYPSTVPTAPSEFGGHLIHAGVVCRVFFDGHTHFIKDARTPLP